MSIEHYQMLSRCVFCLSPTCTDKGHVCDSIYLGSVSGRLICKYQIYRRRFTGEGLGSDQSLAIGEHNRCKHQKQ
eukprot:2619628-Karenia_brevis.AAC.1